MEITAEVSSIKCYVCSNECATYRKLKKHYKKKHKEYEILLCPFCAFPTVDQAEMKKHKKIEHRQDKINCIHCDFATRSWKKWRNHENSLHQEETLTESRSPQNFNSNADYKQIENSSHSLLGVGHKKQKSGHSERHLDVISEGKVHHAVHKKKKVSDQSASEQIVKSSASDGNSLNTSLFPTVPTDGKSTEFSSNSDKKSDIVNSLDSVLQESCLRGTKSYDECDKSFTSSLGLQCHKKAHKNEGLYKCSLCDFSSEHSQSLKSHELLHVNISPFTCDLCDKSFSKKINLTYHLRIHSGDKPFHCPYCEYAAGIKTTLEQHVRGHLGIKPYECDLCEYTTPYRSNLVLHAAKHSEDRPFPCQFCKKQFKRKDHLQNHVRCKHEENI